MKPKVLSVKRFESCLFHLDSRSDSRERIVRLPRPRLRWRCHIQTHQQKPPKSVNASMARCELKANAEAMGLEKDMLELQAVRQAGSFSLGFSLASNLWDHSDRL